MSSNNCTGIEKDDELFHEIAAKVKDGIWVSDKEDRIIFFNTAMENIAGVTADRVIGLKVTTDFGKETTQYFIEYYQKAKTTLVSTEYEAEVVTPSGRVTIQRGWCIPRISGGKYNGIICTIKDITGQKFAEARYVQLFNNMPNGVAVYNAIENGDDFVFSDYNKAAERIDNDRRERILGKSLRQMRPGVESFGLLDVFRRVWSTGKPEHHPVKMYKDNALSGWYDNYVYKLPSGEIVAVFEDVTAIRQAEEALRDSEERFRKIFEEARLGVVITLPSLAFEKANAAFCRMMGYSLEELKSMTFADITHPDHIAQDTEKVRSVGKGEILCYQTQKKYINKNGNVLWGDLLVSSIRDSRGALKYYLSMVNDITERKLAEEKLVQTTERLALATSSGRLGIWDWNLKDNSMVWDDRMFELYGITRGTFSRTIDAWTNGLHCDDKERAIDECNKALTGGKEFNTTFRVVHPDGAVVHIKANGMVIRDAEGKAVRMVGINSDITGIKQTEEALRNAQKLESLGLLAGGIAHDFNNLMGGIYGYIDLASEESRDVNVTAYLSKAMNTIDRARALTQQLLTFAKGGAPIRQIGDLFPFVQETAQFALSGANVSCRFDVPQDLWACDFDRNQIAQVIDNIIINAQQAMPVGGNIELSARNVALSENEHPLLKKGNYVKISIADTGIGIQKELIPKIFDPFFTTKTKGHGLGLATCYSIIKRHDGCIDVDSEPGKGSTFNIYLPASLESASSAKNETDKAYKGSGTFLIMDDEEIMRDTIGNMLKTLGYTVVSKGNGNEAIEFFVSETKANRKIAGMIFDLTVPGGMGGKAAIEEIRKLDKNIPAFVASGYADDPVMKNPVEYGFTASICKPFRRIELTEMLNKYVQSNT